EGGLVHLVLRLHGGTRIVGRTGRGQLRRDSNEPGTCDDNDDDEYGTYGPQTRCVHGYSSPSSSTAGSSVAGSSVAGSSAAGSVAFSKNRFSRASVLTLRTTVAT